MFPSRFPYWVVFIFAIFSTLLNYVLPTVTFGGGTPKVAPDYFGAVSTISFRIQLESGLPKGVGVPYRRQITVSFERDTIDSHFIIPDGAIAMGNPAIASVTKGELVGSTATAIGSATGGTITITLGPDTYTTANDAVLKFSLIGLTNPLQGVTKGANVHIKTTSDINEVTLSPVFLYPIKFSLKSLVLSDTIYNTATTITFNFMMENYDLEINDVIMLRLKKFHGKPKTRSKCVKSPGSVKEGRGEPAEFVLTVDSSSTNGVDLYACDKNSTKGCDIFLTVRNNGLPMETECTIVITGLTTPIVEDKSDTCLSGDCGSKYQIGFVSGSNSNNNVEFTNFVEAGVSGAYITGPGTMTFKSLAFSSYIPAATKVAITFSFMYDKIIEREADKIKLYFKDGVIGTCSAVTGIPFSGCGKIDSFDSAGENSDTIEISLKGTTENLLPGTLCTVTIPGVTLGNNVFDPGPASGDFNSGDLYGVEVIAVNDTNSMAPVSIFPFPAISGGVISSDTLKFSVASALGKTLISYTFRYNQLVTETSEIKLYLMGFTGDAVLISKNGCGDATFSLPNSAKTLPTISIDVDEESNTIPINTPCTLILEGKATSSVSANSLDHKQQILLNGDIQRSTSWMPISKSDAIITSAPNLYVEKKLCKFLGSGADCDHGKLRSVNGNLRLGHSLLKETSSIVDFPNDGRFENICDGTKIINEIGSGSGAVLSVVAYKSGTIQDIIAVTVLEGGSGYSVGDKLKIESQDLGADDDKGYMEIILKQGDISLLSSIVSQPDSLNNGAYYEGLVTTSNGFGKGAILNITAVTGGKIGSIEVACGDDCDGYKVGDSLTVSASRINGASLDLTFILSEDDIGRATYCETCNGRSSTGYTVITSHVIDSFCQGGPQVSCEPLTVASSFVDLYMNPNGYIGDVHCGVYTSSSDTPTTSINSEDLSGSLNKGANGLFPSITTQTNLISVTSTTASTTSTSGSGTGATLDLTASASTLKVTSVHVNNPGSGYKLGDTLTVAGTVLGSVSDLVITLRDDDIDNILVSKNTIAVNEDDKNTDVAVRIEKLTADTLYDAHCHFGDVIPAISSTTRSSILNFRTKSNPAIWGDSITVTSASANADPGALTLIFVHGKTIPEYGEIVFTPTADVEYFSSGTSCSISNQEGGNTAVIKDVEPSDDNNSLKIILSDIGSTVTTTGGKKLVIVCNTLGTNPTTSNTLLMYNLHVTSHEHLRNRHGYVVS